jgi:hypothetical protein
LVQTIISLTDSNAALGGLLRDSPEVVQFHDRLAGSDIDSIDDFLESNPRFAGLGKLCIAASLTVWGPPFNHAPDNAYHWYRYLWGRLHEGAGTTQQFRSNHVRVVTYNYDTSLERYLARVLGNTFPDLAEADVAVAAEVASGVIPIVHLHGSLGKADDTVHAVEHRSRFINLEFLRQAATGIRIVHEDQLSEEYEIAHHWLREAEAVHLLGFGYHPTNVRRLDLLAQAQHSRGWTSFGGTALGLGDAERDRVETSLGIGRNLLRQVDCLSYLRAYAPLE